MELDPNLSVGLEIIDDHHRELLSRIGQLALALRRNDRGEVVHLLDFLRSYISEHFTLEEQEMQRTGYAGYAAHKAAHERFAREYRRLASDCAAKGCTPELAAYVQTTMTGWLQEHVLTMDQDLAAHLLEHGGMRLSGPASPPTAH